MKTQIHINENGLTIEMAAMRITIEAINMEVTRSGLLPPAVHKPEPDEGTHRSSPIPQPQAVKTADGYELICEQCGKKFTATRKKKYCSKSCAQKVYNKNYSDKKKGPRKPSGAFYDATVNAMTGKRDKDFIKRM